LNRSRHRSEQYTAMRWRLDPIGSPQFLQSRLGHTG
jgi:hypothetical protein